MASQVAQSTKLSWRANAMTWWYAYKFYKKSHPGKEASFILTRGLPVLVVITAFFVALEGLSVKTFWNNGLLMTGWLVWTLLFLLARYEINKVRRKWDQHGI